MLKAKLLKSYLLESEVLFEELVSEDGLFKGNRKISLRPIT